MSWLDSPTLSNLAAPGGVLTVILGGAAVLYKRIGKGVQNQHDEALATPPPPEPDTDLLVTSERLVVARIADVEAQLRQCNRRIGLLTQHVVDLGEFARLHPCTHEPPHPTPQLSMELLLGLQRLDTPAAGLQAVPNQRQES